MTHSGALFLISFSKTNYNDTSCNSVLTKPGDTAQNDLMVSVDAVYVQGLGAVSDGKPQKGLRFTGSFTRTTLPIISIFKVRPLELINLDP
jgi:hypothetical protein